MFRSRLIRPLTSFHLLSSCSSSSCSSSSSSQAALVTRFSPVLINPHCPHRPSSQSSSSFSLPSSSSFSSFRSFHTSSFLLRRRSYDDDYDPSSYGDDNDDGMTPPPPRTKDDMMDPSKSTARRLTKQDKLKIITKAKKKAGKKIVAVKEGEEEGKKGKKKFADVDGEGKEELAAAIPVAVKPTPTVAPAAIPTKSSPSPTASPSSTKSPKSSPSSSSSSPPAPAPSGPVLNEKISAPSLLLLDANGTRLGTYSKAEGLAMAREKKLDLLLVSPPHVVPAVCKMLNYGSFLYQQKLREKAAAKLNKVYEVKTVQLRAVIDPHDLSVKLNQSKEWLQKGHAVKFMYKGRDANDENAHLVYVPLFEKVKSGLVGFGDCLDIRSKPVALFNPMKSATAKS